MQPFTQHTGLVATMDRANVDTDQIIPKQFLKRIERTGFGEFLFYDWRFNDNLTPNENFELNRPEFAGATILLARRNFGCGSSREHAAMSPRLLGAAAVITRSFARIHETNLKKQGVLPLTFVDPADYDKVADGDRISVTGLTALAPRTPLTVVLHHADGSEHAIRVKHSLNDEQIEWFKAGSALNVLKRKD